MGMRVRQSIYKMAIVKRIILVTVVASHTFGINAQTYESMEKLASKIVTAIDKGHNTRAFKHYQTAVSILKENQDSLHFYFPIVYAEDSYEEPIVSTMINHMVQIDSTLAEKWLYELCHLWQNHLELLRQYPEVDEFENIIDVNGPLGLLWATESAMADLDSLGSFSYPCDLFFDEAMNIGIQNDEIDDFEESEEDKYWALDWLEFLAKYYDYYRDDNIRAARAYIEYWNQYIDISDFSSEDMEIIQRMLLIYDLATDDIWNLSITEKSLNYIEVLTKEWQILRNKIIDKQGDIFYAEMIDKYLANNECSFPEYFGYPLYEYYINIIVNIGKDNLEAIWQYVDLYFDCVDNPQLLIEGINSILKAFEDCGMAAASFDYLQRLEQHCVRRKYDHSYVIEIQSILAQRYNFYKDVELSRGVLARYLIDIDSYKEYLSPNQYFRLLDAVFGLHVLEEDWNGSNYYANILCEHISQNSEKINKAEKLMFYNILASVYELQGDLENYQKYNDIIIDECKFIAGDDLPIEMTSYPLCRALLEFSYYKLINTDRFQDAIEILELCVDYLKCTRSNSYEEGLAYIYLIRATEGQMNYNLQKHYYEELYKSIIRYFYQYSFSISSSSRSALWQYHSDRLEHASRRALSNESLVDLCYNFALLQKNHLLKYDNLVRNNIYSSKDSILINTYEELVLAQDTKVSNIKQLERRLMDLYSSHIEFRNSHRVYEWQDVQSQLGKNDLAVEFTICYKEDSNSYAALLLKKDWDSPKMIELCEESELKRIMAGGARLYKENAAAYSCIWDKLEPYFKKGDNIYFSPHGLIHQLNIEVLCGKDGKPMNKKCNLYRLSSTGNLVEDRESLKYNSATLYGGLNFDTDTTSMLAINRNYVTTSSLQRGRLLDESVQTRIGWSYLPGTAEEVRNVGNILGRNEIETTTYTDEIGTEESFKALSGNSTPIIHIATHGFYLEDKNARRVEMFQAFEENETPTISPLKRSGLMFSGGQHAWLGKDIPEGIDDGVLTAEEIAGMNLTGTDLLVLSACQTGLGEITNEGVEGLQRGFKIAGVNTIIMSLWEVSDAATEVLMTRFYSLLTKGKTKREAFDAAVEAVKKEYPSPEYWAAFIMLD